ncbi:geranyl transferase [Anaerosporomusa subterranea]|uniref:Farnesyl diphosphate synthase n=1 Tax=Anaerosporomusa subterranea TaxID=1794912 RepID=A0A154BU57_ANASB|nr:farnesyl diphosphate synthase [Anaerosporomusa subterranea]KYZ77516.1 geranyl transferase [Anaerosporomusa subterranea]
MLKQYYQDKIKVIDETLDRMLMRQQALPPVIYDAMRYSLFAGGKRLRPILLMAAADAVGAKGTNYLPVACGLEMIHTYSLIHDDLPAMDNDDYRRGKLTNHKVFGEGMAILAGDALLTQAFEFILSQPGVEAQILVAVTREIAAAAGPAGMVGGQVVDLFSEGKRLDYDTLRYMHQAKTGALFKAALRAGGMLAGASEQHITALTEYAEQFGLAFQITDDILDVTGTQAEIGKPVGSDERNDKATYVTLYSLDTAGQLAAQAVGAAHAALNGFGDEAAILRQMVDSLLSRTN